MDCFADETLERSTDKKSAFLKAHPKSGILKSSFLATMRIDTGKALNKIGISI
jgi:hypothetical protein